MRKTRTRTKRGRMFAGMMSQDSLAVRKNLNDVMVRDSGGFPLVFRTESSPCYCQDQTKSGRQLMRI